MKIFVVGGKSGSGKGEVAKFIEEFYIYNLKKCVVTEYLSLIHILNKWDTVKDPDSELKKWKELIKYELQFVPYAKVVFLSALTKKRINTCLLYTSRCV